MPRRPGFSRSQFVHRASTSTPPSAVKRCVAAIRSDALNTPLGELVGSEDDLLARYEVSRPTLRQAAALVAQEQLIAARRGVGGGYFATRPTAQAVSHMAAIFLQSRAANLHDIIAAITPVHAEMARLAALDADAAARAEIVALLEEQARLEATDFSYRDFLRAARAWETLLGEICGNPVLGLYLRILIDLAAQLAPNQDIYIGRPERAREFLERQRKVAEAILDGDPDVAVLTSRRSSERSLGWIDGLPQTPSWPVAGLDGYDPNPLTPG